MKHFVTRCAQTLGVSLTAKDTNKTLTNLQICSEYVENPCFHCLKGLRPLLLCRDPVLFSAMLMTSVQKFVMQFRPMLQRCTKDSVVQLVRSRHQQTLQSLYLYPEVSMPFWSIAQSKYRLHNEFLVTQSRVRLFHRKRYGCFLPPTYHTSNHWSHVLSGRRRYPSDWSQVPSGVGTPVPGSFPGLWSQVLFQGVPHSQYDSA